MQSDWASEAEREESGDPRLFQILSTRQGQMTPVMPSRLSAGSPESQIEGLEEGTVQGPGGKEGGQEGLRREILNGKVEGERERWKRQSWGSPLPPPPRR